MPPESLRGETHTSVSGVGSLSVENRAIISEQHSRIMFWKEKYNGDSGVIEKVGHIDY